MNITLYALGNYNAGRLIAKTFQLDDYRDHDDYRFAVSEWLDTVPYPYEPERFEEEWIVADWEEVPDPYVGTYDLCRTFWKYFNRRRDVHDSQLEAFDEFYDLFVSGDDDLLPDFDEAYIGHFDTRYDFVEYWFTEIEGMKAFPPLNMCLDYEATEHVISANNGITESKRHFFRMF